MSYSNMTVDYKCTSCGKTSKTERIRDGLVFGNPLYRCRRCQAINYDKGIFEPALLDSKVLIKDKKKAWNIWLILLYFPTAMLVFIAIGLLVQSELLSLAITAVLVIPLTVLILKKKKQISISDFSEKIEESFGRLEADEKYARLIIKVQGNAPDSAWSKKYGTE